MFFPRSSPTRPRRGVRCLDLKLGLPPGSLRTICAHATGAAPRVAPAHLSARRSLWRLPPPARRGHPCPREEKSGEKSEEKAEKKIEEVISRPCVSDEGCTGKPGETVKALPGRPRRAGCGLPGAPKLPRLPRPRRVRPAENSRTGCAGAAGGRASAQAHRWRVLIANQVSAGPFGWPWVRKGRTTKNRRPDRRASRPVNASLLTSARNCSARGGLSKCPRTVRRSRSGSRRAP